MSFASMTMVSSYLAPSSVRNDFQYSTARSHSSPEGHIGRPLRYSNVMSSGAMIPARAPASIAIFEIDMRASMERLSIADPPNSIVYPVPPAVPIKPIMCKMTSFDVTPSPSCPSTRMSMFFVLVCDKVFDSMPAPKVSDYEITTQNSNITSLT